MIGWTSTSTVTGATAPRDRPAGRSRIGRIAAAGVTALLAGTLVPGAMAPASGAVVSAPVAANGFPAFFDDGAVKLGLGPVVDGEAFYFNATASGGKLEVYEAALEGTYTTAPAVTAGQEIAFSRVRFRVTGLDAGQTYTITHPYGVDTFVATADARSINSTVDDGCVAAPCDFTLAGAGFLGDHRAGNTSFLKQVGAPVGTLGDPLVAHPVTGAPSGANAVTISGPNAGGPGINTLTVSDFTVQGQIVAAPAPTASFTTSVASGTAPLVVTLADTSTDAPTSWAWDLGDGTTSTVQNPSVTYAVAGTYTVTLIATNATGASAPVTQTIVVTPPVTIPPTTPPRTPSAARISRVSTSHAAVGDKVTITGKGFGKAGVVKFGSVSSTALSWTDTKIVVRVSGKDYSHRVLLTVTPANRAASKGISFRIEAGGDGDGGHRGHRGHHGNYGRLDD